MASVVDSMASVVEQGGAEGTAIVLFLLVVIAVLTLRWIQSMVQKADYWIATLLPLLAILLVVLVMNRARADSTPPAGQGEPGAVAPSSAGDVTP